MTRTALTLALVLALIAACSDDTPTETASITSTTAPLKTCTDRFTPGRPTADVVADLADPQQPCDNNGEATYLISTSWPCPDGTTVHQVDPWGWGRDGDVWHAQTDPAPYADCVLPGTDPQHP